ncbi:TRAP transporter small permease [Vibrio sp. SCSIO 43137]|uniref:TRAP transporter small permease n=1 Tax=Vibrio sp. SCSIO 43137 TaxID=3021011 RepID=UPI0023080BD5|nr:TRAP transporter small permease [Vibrio sp. SCSIO 43137]WCE30897.1 TRAP transporter small permease [Vibrio sp. SCSIO 43137]
MRASVLWFTKSWEYCAQLLDTALKLFASAALMFMMTLTCVDVAGRYLFDKPVTGSVELTEILLGSLVFLTMPLVTWRKEHISVDLTDSIIPRGIKNIRDMGFDIAVAASLSVIGVKVWDLGDRAFRYGEMTEYLEIPTYYFVYFLAISCWLTALTSLVLVITRLYNKEYNNQKD